MLNRFPHAGPVPCGFRPLVPPGAPGPAERPRGRREGAHGAAEGHCTRVPSTSQRGRSQQRGQRRTWRLEETVKLKRNMYVAFHCYFSLHPLFGSKCKSTTPCFVQNEHSCFNISSGKSGKHLLIWQPLCFHVRSQNSGATGTTEGMQETLHLYQHQWQKMFLQMTPQNFDSAQHLQHKHR